MNPGHGNPDIPGHPEPGWVGNIMVNIKSFSVSGPSMILLLNHFSLIVKITDVSEEMIVYANLFEASVAFQASLYPNFRLSDEVLTFYGSYPTDLPLNGRSVGSK